MFQDARKLPFKIKDLFGRRFRSEKRGSVAVEFAMTATILLGVMFGILQVGYDLYRAQLVSQSVQTAARMIQIGNVPSSATAFRDAICASLAAGLSCDSFYIDVRPIGSDYSEFVNVTKSGSKTFYELKTPAYDSTNTLCAGTAGSFVAIRAAYLASVVSPLWPSVGYIVMNGQRVRGLHASAVIRNEPVGASWGPSC